MELLIIENVYGCGTCITETLLWIKFIGYKYIFLKNKYHEIYNGYLQLHVNKILFIKRNQHDVLKQNFEYLDH